VRLNQIRFFLGVVESGSIRRAARAIGVSAPAITKSLRQLEEELHVRLVERTQHGVVATAAGRAFIARARAVHSELRKAEEELAQFSDGPVRSVVFGVGPTPMFSVVPEALKQFRREYPDARVRIVEGVSAILIPMVRDHTLDFALALRPIEKLDSGLRFRPLFHDSLVIAARKGHPLRNERSLGRLVGAQWVISGANWVAPALSRVFSAAGITAPQPIAQCDSFYSAVALLAESDMLSAMPRRLLMSPLGRGLLQQIPIDERMPSNTQGMLMRADMLATPVVSALVKAVTAVARQLARHA